MKKVPAGCDKCIQTIVGYAARIEALEEELVRVKADNARMIDGIGMARGTLYEVLFRMMKRNPHDPMNEEISRVLAMTMRMRLEGKE